MPESQTHPGGSFELGGRTVARIGFGAMQLGALPGRQAPPREASLEILREALAGGVELIDTAEFYGGGEVNALIREALGPYPESLVVATKIGAEHSAGGLVARQKPEELRAGVEANLRSLGVEALDLVYLRRLDAVPGIVATGDQIVDLDAQLAELAALRDDGKLRAIGLSAADAGQIEAALPVGIAAVQNSYGLLDRDHEPLLALCRERGIAWVPFFPLGSSFDGFRRVTDDPVVREVAAGLEATPAQVGLAWLLARSPNLLLIPGTTSPDHLRENLAAGEIVLDDEALRRLDAAG